MFAALFPAGAMLVFWASRMVGMGPAARYADWTGTLYRPEPTKAEAAPIKAVPYFAWDNREPGEMLVWLRGG